MLVTGLSLYIFQEVGWYWMLQRVRVHRGLLRALSTSQVHFCAPASVLRGMYTLTYVTLLIAGSYGAVRVRHGRHGMYETSV